MKRTKWVSDITHSELGFKIKHLMISNVKGFFRDFQLEVETEGDDFSTSMITLKADMTSINTNNAQRDEHLLASDFFDVAKYPGFQFVSTSMTRIGSDIYDLNGMLTIKGITNPVKLQVEFLGLTKDPWGGERAGFQVSGKINRSDWGISFNSTLETGGVVLGEEVKIISEVQVVKQLELVTA